MNMNNHEIDWLAGQQPQRIGTDAGARERALLALVKHTSSRPASRGANRSGLRRDGLRRDGLNLSGLFRTRMFGVAATGGLAAIAAAVVLSAGGSGQQAALTHSGQAPQTTVKQGPRTALNHHAAARSPLVRLADYVSASGNPAGDATLVARTTTITGQSPVTVYDVYADSGPYYFSRQASGLQAQVDAHHNLAGGLFAREIAAAKLAATGSVQTAAQDMAEAPDPSHVVSRTQPTNLAAITRKLALMGKGKPSAAEVSADASTTLFNNYAWEDSQDALIAGAGVPAVRAGVLQILATLPGVTVTHGTAGDQPTLVLTAGAPELGYGYTEQLTINADTGVPIRFVGGSSLSNPATTVTYKVSRVTLANLSASTGASGS